MIPAFPEFKPIGIEGKAVLDNFIKAYPSEACEINFTNLYIWRRFEKSRYTFVDGNLCILCEPPGEPPYFLPPVGNTDLEGTVRRCLEIAPRLSRVPEEFVLKFCGGLKAEEDRDNFDYIYRTEDLIRLAGKRYDGKRNWIKRFEKNFSCRYLRLTPELADDCRRLFDEWFEKKINSDPAISAEKSAILDALADFERLSLTGGAIDVGGRIRAFSIGEKMTDSTAVIHIEIADRQFPGLAQLINREFVRNEWSGFEFVNREQDAGVSGLRRAKLSYHPVRFIKKYNVGK